MSTKHKVRFTGFYWSGYTVSVELDAVPRPGDRIQDTAWGDKRGDWEVVIAVKPALEAGDETVVYVQKEREIPRLRAYYVEMCGADNVIADTTDIPDGSYCYRFTGENGVTADGRPSMKTVPCPHWHLLPGKPHQSNGYCALLGRGDWDEVEPDGRVVNGTSLLWDGVKECGLHNDDDL